MFWMVVTGVLAITEIFSIGTILFYKDRSKNVF
jgi:hypothetical protein